MNDADYDLLGCGDAPHAEWMWREDPNEGDAAEQMSSVERPELPPASEVSAYLTEFYDGFSISVAKVELAETNRRDGWLIVPILFTHTGSKTIPDEWGWALYRFIGGIWRNTAHCGGGTTHDKAIFWAEHHIAFVLDAEANYERHKPQTTG